MPVTTGMKDQGFYDRHSTAQAGAIQALQTWIEDAAIRLPLPPENQPINVLDLGSSEGRNAFGMMRTVVAALRRRTPQAIETLYSDLHTNNFNQLFRTLQEQGTPDAAVYPAAVPGSFYGPLRPNASVHLAMCFNAILWLDHLPATPIPDFVIYRRPRPDRPIPPEQTAAFAGQANADLMRFLEQRARELVPGGQLVLGTPGDTAEASVIDGLYDVLDEGCRDLVAAGQLNRQRYENFVMPVYPRTLDEILAPLQRQDSPVAGAFQIERAETLEAPNPFSVAFRQTGNREAYAEATTGFLRAFSESVVRGALVGPDGDPTLIETLYQRIHVRLAADPERYAFRYIFVAVQLQRTAHA